MSAYTRQLAIDKARDEIATKLVYLDTETTGLGDSDEIVDICIVDTDGTVLLDSLVKPIAPISPEVTKVHGITNEMVANAPTWKALYPQVEAVLRHRRVAIYNAEYDVRMMRQSGRKHQLPWAFGSEQFFCIMLLYAQFYGEWNTYRGSYKWHKLEAAGQQCRITLPNSHRAQADALLARAVLHYMAGQKV